MSVESAERAGLFDRIAGRGGGLSMVAMDQRESLRTMFGEATGEPVADATLEDFKLAVAETLSPYASAMLLDREYGEKAMHALAPSCGLVVAADRLDQPAGQPVVGTDLDTDLDITSVHAWGGAALKLLVLWYAGDDHQREKDMVRRFLDLCRNAALLSIVEGVVKPPRSGAPWDREGTLLEAAGELGGTGCDLYKAEVPMYGRGDLEVVQERCEAITAMLPCPWVVLSSGVSAQTFPDAVRAACRGGASGFLAGRAIWMDLVGPGDYRSRLGGRAVERLQRLSEIVEACARPWSTALK